jgi:polyvinyl alcohol dehydrogenase (cytochrome)
VHVPWRLTWLVPVSLCVPLAISALAAALVGTGSAAATTPAPQASGGSWTTYDFDPSRTGTDPSGLRYSVGSPAWTSPHLDGSLFGQPLVGGSLVYVATENDTVYALSASTGAVAWSAHVGTPFNPSVVPSECGDIRPTVGITSTPVIDVVRSEIFVVADEASGNTAAHHLIGLDLATGHVQLDEIIDPSGSDPAFQLQRVSLALTAGRVIVGFGGNAGDCGSYHGLVVSAPEDGSTPAVFTVASLTGDRQGAVWMGGGAPVIDGQGNVWVSTGNSAHVHAGDAYDDSDGVLELSPTMQLLGFFAPTTWYSDNAYDADFSTPPTLLDNGLVLAMGKSSIGYVLNQASLGGIGGQLTSTPACFGRGASAHVGNVVYQGCFPGRRQPSVAAGAVVVDLGRGRVPDRRRRTGLERQLRRQALGHGPDLRVRGGEHVDRLGGDQLPLTVHRGRPTSGPVDRPSSCLCVTTAHQRRRLLAHRL